MKHKRQAGKSTRSRGQKTCWDVLEGIHTTHSSREHHTMPIL